jgi:hypothetical protein
MLKVSENFLSAMKNFSIVEVLPWIVGVGHPPLYVYMCIGIAGLYIS